MFRYYILVFIICAGTSLIMTPLIRKISSLKGFLDRPSRRKVHRKNIPTLGGIAIYVSLFVGLLFLINTMEETTGYYLIGLLIGSSLIVLLGIYDDLKNLSPWIKLAGQIIIALLLYYYGFRIERISTLSLESISLGYASVFITVIWIVGIINAINLLDGLDGLACGITAIVAIFLFIASLLDGNFIVCFLTAILAGACLGFLPYNFYPASIFMGDTGSMLLGLLLSLVAIKSYQKSTTIITVLIPIIALSVPLIDTSLSVLRRFIGRKPLFKADRNHIHHRLLMEERSQKKAVLNLYLVTCFFSLIALGLRGMSGFYAVISLAIFVFVTFRWIKNSGFMDVKGK